MRIKKPLSRYSGLLGIAMGLLVYFQSTGIAFAQWNSGSLGSTFGLPENDVESVLLTVLNWLLSIVGILGVIGFVVSGLMYITAVGDEKKAENAKRIILYSIVGVVVALIGLIVVTAIESIFVQGSDDALTLRLMEDYYVS
jgi:cytochrome bd-type quinol oxidase subunit 2